MATQQILNVKIISPTQVFFDDQALSVSSKNLLGNFDVLPQHANMITFIEKSQPIVIRKLNKEKIEFKFPMAIIYVRENQVTIYSQPEVLNL